MSLQLFRNILRLFDKKYRYYIGFIFSIFVLLMFLELFSITLFIPLISFILETKISENSFYLFFKNNFDLDLAFILNDLKTFILFFIAIFLIKSFLTIFCHYHKIGFTYKIRKYLTTNIYQKYLGQVPKELIILYMYNMRTQQQLIYLAIHRKTMEITISF